MAATKKNKNKTPKPPRRKGSGKGKGKGKGKKNTRAKKGGGCGCETRFFGGGRRGDKKKTTKKNRKKRGGGFSLLGGFVNQLLTGAGDSWANASNGAVTNSAMGRSGGDFIPGGVVAGSVLHSSGMKAPLA